MRIPLILMVLISSCTMGDDITEFIVEAGVDALAESLRDPEGSLTDTLRIKKRGITVVMRYNESDNTFVGTAENTTENIVTNIEVKVATIVPFKKDPKAKRTFDLEVGEKKSIEIKPHKFTRWKLGLTWKRLENETQKKQMPRFRR